MFSKPLHGEGSSHLGLAPAREAQELTCMKVKKSPDSGYKVDGAHDQSVLTCCFCMGPCKKRKHLGAVVVAKHTPHDAEGRGRGFKSLPIAGLFFG